MKITKIKDLAEAYCVKKSHQWADGPWEEHIMLAFEAGYRKAVQDAIDAVSDVVHESDAIIAVEDLLK